MLGDHLRRDRSQGRSGYAKLLYDVDLVSHGQTTNFLQDIITFTGAYTASNNALVVWPRETKAD